MLESGYLYLALMGLAFVGPFFLSFDRKVAFYKNWRYLLPATLIMATIFLVWDILFTWYGVWGFNPTYLSGISLLGLPLGEYLFFLVVPYCCVFIYEVVNAYFPQNYLGRFSASISNFLMGFSATMAVIFYDKVYTLLNFALLTLLIFHFSRIRTAPWLGQFYLSFLIIIIPFFLINSVLTGSFIEQEVVWYNAETIVGVRLGTIPMEDLFYAMTLILGIVGIFESLRSETSR